ncbi:hypothetical protein U1Q18_028769 [Sarracenia purpurea var. burkii]
MAMEGEGGGGGTLSELYHSSKRLLLKTRDGLERLERLEFSSSMSSSSSNTGVDSPELSFAVKRDIAQIQSLCVEMDRLWRSIAVKSQRDLWKRKVEQVAEEADSLKESLDKYTLRNQRRIQEARERAELLRRANGESSHVLRIFDEEAQALQSARNSSRMLEESYATGVAILAQYAGQRERLKGLPLLISAGSALEAVGHYIMHKNQIRKNLFEKVETEKEQEKERENENTTLRAMKRELAERQRAQRKALDVLNTVGVSNFVLKLIERRHRVDKWIKYIGMVLTIIILIAIWSSAGICLEWCCRGVMVLSGIQPKKCCSRVLVPCLVSPAIEWSKATASWGRVVVIGITMGCSAVIGLVELHLAAIFT